MSNSTVLSAPEQKLVLSEIDSNERLNTVKAKKNAGWFLGTALASAVLFAVCPPAGLLSLIPAVTVGVSLVFGTKLAGNALAHETLEKAKAGAGKEGFVDKIKRTASRLYNAAKTADKVSDIGLYATVGGLVGMLLFPHVALAAALWNAGVLVMAGGAAVNLALRDSKTAASDVSVAVQTAKSVAAPVAPAAAAPATPAPSLAPGLTPGFAQAANTNTARPEAPANDAAAPQPPKIAPAGP